MADASTPIEHISFSSGTPHLDPTAVDFPMFCEFPTELRLLIWGHAFEARLFRTFLHPTLCRTLEVGDDGGHMHWSTTPEDRQPLPAVVQVCKESRNHLLRLYTHLLQHPLKGSPPLHQAADVACIRTYGIAGYNPYLDTIELRGRNFDMLALAAPEDELAQIKNLKWDCWNWNWDDPGTELLFIKCLPRYKTLEHESYRCLGKVVAANPHPDSGYYGEAGRED